jgi:hypothetical protein
VELDGQKIENIASPEKEKRLWLHRENLNWKVGTNASAALKGPTRYGTFKDAFRNNVQFVYGTHGSAAEKKWAQAKARYDAEVFWYRGNASVDVIPDTEFQASTGPDRNVILYGNSATNAAWKALMGESPVQVGQGKIQIGDKELKGDDLACLFVRPRPGSDRAMVGAVAGTGLPGMRLSDRLPYFVSGVGYPDCLVLSSEMLAKGMAGVRAAGFFGLDWGVDSGEFAWQK